jgi:putative ABC transport system permease protein
MESIWQDIRYSVRGLIKRPGFTIAAVMALALGIAANSVIFSVINTVLLRPLPYDDPDRLVLLWTKFEPDLPQNWVSGPEVLDIRQRSTVFEGIAALAWQNLNLTGTGEPEQIQAGAVTSNLFQLLGIKPVQGRVFLPEEDLPGSERVVILSHGLWQRRFGSDTNIVGKTISLDNQSYLIVGIMPPDFGILPPDAQSPKNVDLWMPAATDLSQLNRGSHFLRVIAKIRPGTSLEQAKAEMDTVGKNLDAEFYGNSNFGITVSPLHRHVVKDIRPALLVLLGAVSFVLLIACVNVANLLLAKAIAREKEIAIRIALGAGRWRLIKQLLTESLVLSLLSGVVSLVLSFLGLKALKLMSPDNVPRLSEVTIDARVLGFTLLISMLTGIVFGLVPALQSSKLDLNDSLKEGGKGAGGDTGRGRLRSFLVVSEVALTLVLLTGAGLMIKSFMRLQEVDPGFYTDNLLTLRLQLPQSKYPENPQLADFSQRLSDRLGSLPGVESVGMISHLPLSGAYASGTVTADQPQASIDNASFEADRRAINTDYFKTMGISLLKGRAFTDMDKADSQGVVIIDEKFEKRFWPNDDPIGKRLKFGGSNSTAPWLSIVGVVRHVKHYSLNEEGREMVYFPIAQRPLRSMYIVLRSKGDPNSLISAVRNEVWSLDKDQPISNINTMEKLVYTSVAQPRFNMMLLAIFATVALILAAIGIYGVMSYSVSQRMNEIGIRIALGAQNSDILKLIVGHGMLHAAAGIAIGLMAAFALTRLMSSLLYGVSATDPIIYLLISLLLATVAFLASFIPARRAIKADPVVTLRYQ